MKIKLLLISFLIGTSGLTQFVSEPRMGVNASLILNFGSHVNSIGVNLKAYYQDYFFQLNTGSSITRNITSYGSRKHFWESRSVLGLILLGGERSNTIDFQLDGLNHQSPYNYGVGYNYLWYYDNAGTSQLSGGWSLHLKKFALYMENDVFGGQAKDRYRSGHFAVNYRYEDFKFGTGFYIWTGETDGAVWERIPSIDCPYGFKILEDNPFGKTSHGILYSSVFYNGPYGQNVFLKLGVDDENIRNFVQNRLIHDLIWLPKGIERKTPHYPRLDSLGCPVFFKEEARKPKVYFQTGSGDNWSN